MNCFLWVQFRHLLLHLFFNCFSFLSGTPLVSTFVYVDFPSEFDKPSFKLSWTVKLYGEKPHVLLWKANSPVNALSNLAKILDVLDGVKSHRQRMIVLGHRYFRHYRKWCTDGLFWRLLWSKYCLGLIYSWYKSLRSLSSHIQLRLSDTLRLHCTGVTDRHRCNHVAYAVYAFTPYPIFNMHDHRRSSYAASVTHATKLKGSYVLTRRVICLDDNLLATRKL